MTRTQPTVQGALATSLDVSVRDGVTLTLHVTNPANDPLELSFPSGQTHDFVILDATGRELWRWSDDQMFTQALQTRKLAAHETVTYEEQWRGAPKTGRFTALGVLRSGTHPVEARVEFTLP